MLQLKGGRTPDSIEQDLLNALERLIEGKPESKKLKTKVASGKLKISISNVALEAGHSRTLIGLEDCRYPEVRELIKDAIGGKAALPTTYTQLIENLRADKAALFAEKRLLETAMATHVLARRKAEMSSRRDAAEAARLRKRVVELEKVTQLPSRDAAPARLVLIRGLPGSGKSTKANGYVNDGYMHFEADQFFLVNGAYQFDPERLPEAHEWCLSKTRDALAAGEFVCVANVFATVEDIRPYTDLGIEYELVEVKYPGMSIHEVPADVLSAMQSSWVPTDRLLAELQKVPRPGARVTPINSKKTKH